MGALDVFADVTDLSEMVTTYRVSLQVIDKMVGGVPSSKSVIEAWLKSRLDLGDRDLQEQAEATLKARFPDRQPSAQELAGALAENPEGPSINGFKRHPEVVKLIDGARCCVLGSTSGTSCPAAGQLVYEGRCMKAAVKEWMNSCYPGTEWPGKNKVALAWKKKPTTQEAPESDAKSGAKKKPDAGGNFRKGLLSTAAERVFVPELYIPLGVTEPDEVEERIKHVSTPQGPRSSINRVEIVYRPILAFTLIVHDDFLPREGWARVWLRGEDIGLGSDRARSDGRFKLKAFDRI